MASQRTSERNVAKPPERASRARQRQRLIDACISALHIHGPSHTTVEKVVAIAEMSPGIVRFYFDSKDAMLVASLAHLAAEFEAQVMKPVAALKETPVRALERLVELYFDPLLASPRKVSVWYSFWGEASSRQEYHEICGRKDEEFAVLVRELIERMIALTGATHLDADGIALGLMGVLEVLWQGIAFSSESALDRAAYRRRSLAYLGSVFPQQFGGAPAFPVTVNSRVPAWAYVDGTLLNIERDRLFRPSWQLVGHIAEVVDPGDYLAVDLVADRALVVRGADDVLRAFRNSCRNRPHALATARSGRFTSGIVCRIHELEYGLNGRWRAGAPAADLARMSLALWGSLILVQAGESGSWSAPPGDWAWLSRMRPAGQWQMEVAADWKVLMEQWLDGATPRPKSTQRRFLPPNQMLDLESGRALFLQLLAEPAGRCRIRCLDFGVTRARASRRPSGGKGGRIPAWLAQDIALAESTQAGWVTGVADAGAAGVPASVALADFRRGIAALLPAAESARRAD